MSKVTKIEFFCTDDEIQLVLESVNQYKCKCEYEGINMGMPYSFYQLCVCHLSAKAKHLLQQFHIEKMKST